MTLRSLLAMAACLAACPAAVLLTPPDRDDVASRQLASKYLSSIALAARAAEALLIAPN